MKLWQHPRLAGALCALAVLVCAAAPAVFLAAADAAALGRTAAVQDPYTAPTTTTCCASLQSAPRKARAPTRPCRRATPRRTVCCTSARAATSAA